MSSCCMLPKIAYYSLHHAAWDPPPSPPPEVRNNNLGKHFLSISLLQYFHEYSSIYMYIIGFLKDKEGLFSHHSSDDLFGHEVV